MGGGTHDAGGAGHPGGFGGGYGHGSYGGYEGYGWGGSGICTLSNPYYPNENQLYCH